MILGEKILTIKSRLSREVFTAFQAAGVDPVMGCVLLDAIKADLMELGYRGALEEKVEKESEKDAADGEHQ